MPEPDDRVEFLDETAATTADEALPAPPPRSRLTLIVAAALGAAVVVVVVLSRAGPSPPPAVAGTTATVPTVSVSPADPTPTVVPPPPTVYPPEPIRRVVALTCQPGPSCRVRAAGSDELEAARRALRPVRDLQVRTIGPGRATLVAALRDDGAQLLAIVTRRGIHVDPTRLAITPPIAVQSQTNGADRLTVVVSGSADAVALLGSPRIQRWLASLSAA